MKKEIPSLYGFTSKFPELSINIVLKKDEAPDHREHHDLSPTTSRRAYLWQLIIMVTYF